MYDNIGSKIKTVAKVVGFAGIVISILAGLLFLLVAFSEEKFSYFGIGILVAILGSIISWASTIALYGFGQIVENTDVLVQDSQINKSSLQCIRKAYDNMPNMRTDAVDSQYESIYNTKYQEARPDKSTVSRYCTNCEKIVTGNFCPYCGTPDLKDMPLRNSRQ